MKTKFLSVNYVLSILTVMFALLVSVTDVSAAIGTYEIVCGQTAKGQAIKCNTGTHKCVSCTERAIDGIWRWFTPVNRVNTTFSCKPKDYKLPKNCSVSQAGGLVGESYTQWGGPLLNVETGIDEGTQCVTNNFLAMYTATCYSCEIVETLAAAFIKAAAQAYDVSKDLANAVLVVGMIIWVAIFVLKNLSSFTTVEPRKMIQDLLIMLFKIYVVFVIVNSGIPTILHYTMEPIMIAGTDFADVMVGDVAPNGYISEGEK